MKKRWQIIMTNKEALDIVLSMAKELRETSKVQREDIEMYALSQMEDYYNDVVEDKMEHNHTQDQHDRVMINRIKLDVKEWMETHGQIMSGEEISDDVCKIIDESVERTKRIREDWMKPDRS